MVNSVFLAHLPEEDEIQPSKVRRISGFPVRIGLRWNPDSGETLEYPRRERRVDQSEVRGEEVRSAEREEIDRKRG